MDGDDDDGDEGQGEGDANGGGKSALDETTEAERLLAKKRKLKEAFDTQFDEDKTVGEKKTHYDTLKEEMEQQSQLNRSVFAGLDDEQRIKYEGFRPGLYVRIKFNRVCFLFIRLPAYSSIGLIGYTG